MPLDRVRTVQDLNVDGEHFMTRMLITPEELEVLKAGHVFDGYRRNSIRTGGYQVAPFRNGEGYVYEVVTLSGELWNRIDELLAHRL